MLLSVCCGLSCSSVVVCGVYVGVLVWAFASMLLQLVGPGQLHSFITFRRVTTNYISSCVCASPAFACVAPVQGWACR